LLKQSVQFLVAPTFWDEQPDTGMRKVVVYSEDYGTEGAPANWEQIPLKLQPMNTGVQRMKLDLSRGS
jgi:hypothetical protein